MKFLKNFIKDVKQQERSSRRSEDGMNQSLLESQDFSNDIGFPSATGQSSNQTILGNNMRQQFKKGSLMVAPEMVDERQPYMFGALAKVATKAAKSVLSKGDEAAIRNSKDYKNLVKELTTDNAKGAGVVFKKSELKEFESGGADAALEAFGELRTFKIKQDDYANKLLNDGVKANSVKRILNTEIKEKDLTPEELVLRKNFLEENKMIGEADAEMRAYKDDVDYPPSPEELKEMKASGGRVLKQEGSLMVPPEMADKRQPYVVGALVKAGTKAAKIILQQASDEVKNIQKTLPKGKAVKEVEENIESMKQADRNQGDELEGYTFDIATSNNIENLEKEFFKDPALANSLQKLKKEIYSKYTNKEVADDIYEDALFKIDIKLEKNAPNTQEVFPEDAIFKDLKGERRVPKQEGSLMVPPEMEGMESDMPEDTYPNIPPEEMAEAEASQLPDSQMEDNYMDFVLTESLDDTEQTYLMNALETDEKLSQIFDKVITTASEFSGAGEVEGPGTGVSDSIPARLSDGEFVFTKKATDQVGADQLQTMMDEAEKAYDGGVMRKPAREGGSLLYKGKDEDPLSYEKIAQDEIKKGMLRSNRAPSLNPG